MCECAICQVRFNKLLEKKAKRNEYDMSLITYKFGVKGIAREDMPTIPYSDYMDKVLPLPEQTKVSKLDYVKRCVELGVSDMDLITEFYTIGEYSCKAVESKVWQDQPLTEINQKVISDSLKGLHNV
jgi:hypothetical protein